MSKYPAIDKNTEMKALAMLVRGDTYNIFNFSWDRYGSGDEEDLG